MSIVLLRLKNANPNDKNDHNDPQANEDIFHHFVCLSHWLTASSKDAMMAGTVDTGTKAKSRHPPVRLHTTLIQIRGSLFLKKDKAGSKQIDLPPWTATRAVMTSRPRCKRSFLPSGC